VDAIDATDATGYKSCTKGQQPHLSAYRRTIGNTALQDVYNRIANDLL
jgi:hypothetical protein